MAPLLNQTTTVQKIIDQCSLHTKLQNFFAVGGITNEPGLTIANNSLQMLLTRSNAWKHNVGVLAGPPSYPQGSFFVTQYGVQDILHAGACAFVLLNQTTAVLPCGGVGIDLAVKPVGGGAAGISISGTTVTVQTLQPHPFQVGQTFYMSGNTAAAFNSIFTFNTTTTFSAWTNGFIITAVPDNMHIQFTATNRQVATIIHISAAAGITTVTCTNTMAVGDVVTFTGIGTNTALNGLTVTLLTASGSQVTFTTPPSVTITNGNDTGTILIAGSGAPGINDWGWMQQASMTDINSQSFPQPIKPIIANSSLAPSYYPSGDPAMAVAMVVDFQNGVLMFRILDPFGTYSYQINVFYQKRANKLTSPQSVFSWPDNLSFVLIECALWQAYRFATGNSSEETRLQFAAAQAAIAMAQQSQDLEDTGQTLVPTATFMGGSF